MVINASFDRLGYENSVVILDRFLTAFCATDYIRNLENCEERDTYHVKVGFTVIKEILDLMKTLSSTVAFPISIVHKDVLLFANIQKCINDLHQILLRCSYTVDDECISLDDCYRAIRRALKTIITNQISSHSLDDLIELFTKEDRARANNLVKFAFANDGRAFRVTEALLSTEVANCQAWVPLWLKVRRVRTRDQLLQLASDHLCEVCKNADLKVAQNFAILDLCDHIYCVKCTKAMLFIEERQRCPYCRSNIGAWMTLKTFTKHRINMDARRVLIESETTTVIKRLVNTVKNASSVRRAGIISAIFCMGIVFYFKGV